MALSGKQLKELQLALIDAFPNTTSLERMLLYELDKNLRVVAGEGSLQDIVFKLIQAANSQGWFEDLVYGACSDNPGNPKLKAIAQELLLNFNSEKSSAPSINNPLLTAQAVNKIIYVLLFNPYTAHEGIHTIFVNGCNKILMFELAEDATDFAKKLIEEKPNNLNIPTPAVRAENAQEIITFCQRQGFNYELIPARKKIILPSTWVDKLAYQ